VTNSSADYPIAIFGIATATEGNAIGVAGNNASPDGYAVYGRTTNGGTAVRAEATGPGRAVYAVAENAKAIVAESETAHGVWGEARSDNMYGVVGKGMGSCLGIDCDVRIGFSHGVLGESHANGIGVVGISGGGDGVQGVSRTPDFAGVRGINRYGGTAVYGLSQEGGTAIYGRSEGGGYAAFFDGKAGTKILEIRGGADLAERFEVSGGEAPEPGTLMAIDPDNPGHLRPSDQPYDARVAGVVSGAGDVQPGLTLYQEGVIEGDAVVAIAGRVYVRAEALSAPIQPGDLLTTSGIAAGHAMKASDRERAYGAVIGKAMTGLSEGKGLVLVLVNLQ
jgi:hypothetical protein